MLRKLLLPLLLCLLAISPARADDDDEIDLADHGVGLFVFKVPHGWHDKSTPLITVAVDDKHKLVFQAKVVKGGDAADDALLEKYVSDAQRSLQRLMPAARLDVKKKQLVKIAGMPAARFLFDMEPGAGQEPVRTLQFYLPAPAIDQHAILTFTGPPAEFDKQVKLFDKIARATVIKSK